MNKMTWDTEEELLRHGLSTDRLGTQVTQDDLVIIGARVVADGTQTNTEKQQEERKASFSGNSEERKEAIRRMMEK